MASKGVWRGTWNGPGYLVPGHPGTGQKLEFAWCGMDRWDGDKIVEEWTVNDFLSMMLQTGLITWPG